MQQFTMCACRKTAKRRASWAAVIIKCNGGFMAFEFVTDAARWRGQK